MVGWDVRSLDTRLPANDVIVRVLKQAGDGSIVLLHDGAVPAKRLMGIVSEVVSGLRERGLGFERVDRLIENGRVIGTSAV